LHILRNHLFLQPDLYPIATALEMANGSVWAWDQLPVRNQKLRAMLNTDYARPAALFIHCSAGCDRTGEVVGR
jgi:protein tyrosine phosphatase